MAAEPHLDQMLTKMSGSATSPDALYIYDSIAAANEILHIALRLAQMGSLRYLPSRYLINISYAAVFALKSSYSGAVEEKDMHRYAILADIFKIVLMGRRIRELVDHVCTGLVLSCPDKDHPAVRYGQMLRMLSKRLEELHDASVSRNRSGQSCVFTPIRRRFRPVIPLLSPSKRLPTQMHLHK